MSSSDSLFLLIKSLRRGEKRSFKLFASQYSKGDTNIYVRLFDAIDASNEYDEEAIKKKFAKENFIKQLAVTKNYLFHIILKSLRIYHYEEDIDFKINEGVESAKILYQRGLYRQAAKIIERTKEFAHETQCYELLLNMIHVEVMIMNRYLTVGELKNYLEQSKQEFSHILTVIDNREGFQTLYDSIFFVYRTYGVPRSDEEKERYAKIVAHPLMSSEDNAISLQAKCYFNVILTVYYVALNMHNKAFEHVLREIFLIEQNPKLIMSHINRYLSALNNALHIQVDKKDFAGFQQTIARIKNLPEQVPYIGIQTERRLFEITYSLELPLYFKLRWFDKGLSLVPQVEAGLLKYEGLGGALDLHIDICYEVLRMYFFSDKYKEAHYWTDRIIEKEKANIAIDRVCDTKILDLFIHYEKGNYTYIEYQLKSIKRFLEKNNRLLSIEKLFLNLLSKLITSNAKQKQQDLLHAKREYSLIAESPYKENAFQNLPLIYWVESKISAEPLLQIMQRDKTYL